MRNVNRLRVIDASLPLMVSGNINAVLMIGEKGAELVKSC